MTKISKEQANEELKKGTEKVSYDDLKTVLDKKAKIENKFRNNGPLGRFINDLVLLFAIIKDYINGEYREIPWWSIAAIVGAFLYVLTPIDLIPDIIPVIGYVDDALVVAACLSMVENDLLQYKQWNESIV